MPRIRVAAAQLNLVVGDLEGNEARILDAYERAGRVDADLVAFPELAVTGYPPEDLLLRPAFVADAAESIAKLAAHTTHVAAVLGFPELMADGTLANSAALCAHGAVQGIYRKHLLPNYSVFDEERYFEPWAEDGPLFVVAGLRIGLTICEDAWSPTGPILTQAEGGAELIVNINASPYFAGRVGEREAMLATRAIDAQTPILYANLVGGQDELVFDGASMVIDEHGTLVARALQFEEDLLVADLDVRRRVHRKPPVGRPKPEPLAEVAITEGHLGMPGKPARIEPLLESVHEVYRALVLGTRDYMVKNGFTHVLLGLSGGIDSSLVAAVAADALGPDKVTGVMMPSRFSSEGSVTDSRRLAENLGIGTLTIPIEPAHESFIEMLAVPFAGMEPGVAEENLQARIRGTILMTISNKFGWLVLTTGNKSEMATGYSTLYGDMAGGFAVIKDVPKMLVYALCEDINRRLEREVVPRSVIEKPPSAELRPDQKDEDSLPPYPVLDAILEGYVEDDRSIADLVGEGFDRETVVRIARLVDRSEYKRRQAPPGVRVTPKAFGRDRRLPLTNRWPG
ncbi:MAG: NAD+ synthase [Acidimicrobiia bacterium]|nr:NAD+ synthase [Acidimicrobiia bacterium]